MYRARFYSGVLLIAAAVLMLQIVQTRILSVVLWYYLAFLIISLAMFGMAAGAVWVYLRRARFTKETLSYDLAYFSGAFAVATTVGTAIEMSLAMTGAATAVSILIYAELLACLIAPFFFAGVVVSLALTRGPFPVGRVYAADLAGAAIGCLGALFLLNMTDGPSASLWIGALGALSAICFASARIGVAPVTPLPLASRLLKSTPLFLVLAAIAFANGLTGKGLQPLVVKGHLEASENPLVFTKWNSFSRIALSDWGRQRPYLWGPSPTLRPDDWTINQLSMNVDGDAATFSYRLDGDLNRAGFLRYDVTNLAHFLPGHKRAAVIGVGGGRDMLSALLFGIHDITGVEINPILVHLLVDAPEYAAYSSLLRAPGIKVHTDEARSWFARSKDRFDIIQMSLVDTFAATGAGAFTLTENGLYTVQGWKIFLDHLTPHGVLTVSRWFARDNVDETGRMVSLATAALFALGIDNPKAHLFLAASGDIATLVVSRLPFAPPDVATLNDVSSRMKYAVLLSPNGVPASPVLGHIVDSRDEAELEQFTSTLPLDLTPPTDERPFFFNQLPLFDPWRTLKLSRQHLAVGSASGNLAATKTLIFLFLISVFLVVRMIVYPLRHTTKDIGRRFITGGTAYFFLIGFGFMSIEIGLLQRMSIFLGHPVYSLGIVLFSLILSTGLGSLVSDVAPIRTRTELTLWSIVTAGGLFLLPLVLPSLLLSFDSASLLGRAAVCLVVIAPAGMFMGYAFPTGMRLVAQVDERPTPWFWGVNGAAGVLSSAFAVAVSIAFGIYVTLLVGAACYLLLIPAALAITTPAKQSAARNRSGSIPSTLKSMIDPA